MQYSIELISASDVLTVESVSSFIGRIHGAFATASEGVHKFVAKLTQDKDTLTPVMPVEKKLMEVNWPTFSEQFMLVPEGLERGLDKLAVTVGDKGEWLLKDYMEVLQLLNTTIDRAIAGTVVPVTELQSKSENHGKHQLQFMTEVSKCLGISGKSHLLIRKVFNSPAQATAWYKQTVGMSQMPVNQASIDAYSAMLSTIATKLATYGNMTVANHTNASIVQAQMISNLALAIANQAEIVSTVTMLYMQNKNAALKFSKLVLG